MEDSPAAAPLLPKSRKQAVPPTLAHSQSKVFRPPENDHQPTSPSS
jgi:hypothetical protein